MFASSLKNALLCCAPKSSYRTRLNKLRAKQNKCMRNIFFAHSREHSTPYYNLLEILSFMNIVNLSQFYLHVKLSKKKKGYARHLYSLALSSQQLTYTLVKLDTLPKEICMEQAFALTKAIFCLDIRQFKCGKVSHHT